MEIRARNVNIALTIAIDKLIGQEMLVRNGLRHNLEQDSRNGPVLAWEEPVLTIYQRPCERVLFSPARDANPFFHFFEALWILAGRRDVAFVTQFVKRMADYSDDGTVFNGAYGYRARRQDGDQLEQIIHLLQEHPDTRRAVISLWKPEDAWSAEDSKDIPCNTQLYFRVHNGWLDLTITNRSNDILWGAYGANAVHFSVLQEYVAGKIGAHVGKMYQFSNNWHVYTGGPGGALYQKLKDNPPIADAFAGLPPDPYQHGRVVPYYMRAGDPGWDDDLALLFYVDDDFSVPVKGRYITPFFNNVVIPMRETWRKRTFAAAGSIYAVDWRIAAVQWLERRGYLTLDGEWQ